MRGTHHDRRNEVMRTVLSGAAVAALAAVLGGSPLVVLIGAVVGTLIAFVVERLIDDYGELRNLRTREREFDAATTQREQERKLWEHRIVVAQRESALNAAMLKVWGDGYIEGIRTGHYPPLEALMARLEMTQKARGIDKPVPPPDL